MKICCSKCTQTFESLVIPAESAWRDVYTAMLRHSYEKHKDVVEMLGKKAQEVNIGVVVYMTCSELVTIPDSEEWVLGHLDTMQNALMEAAGYVETEETEDDEEEELDEDEEIESDDEVINPDNGIVDLG